MTTSERHEELVKKKVERLEAEGWHIVTIGRNHPDAIAVKDGVIMAVEILRKMKRKTKQKRKGKGQSRGWRYQGGLTLAEKVRRYSRFDKTAFVIYYGSTGKVADDFEIFSNGDIARFTPIDIDVLVKYDGEETSAKAQEETLEKIYG